MQEIETYLVENEVGELEINPTFIAKLEELKKAKEKIEKELKQLTGNITNELREHYTETTKISGYNFTVKGGFYDVEFDLETFKRENFETYVKYLKPHESKVTYVLASAERKKRDVQ